MEKDLDRKAAVLEGLSAEQRAAVLHEGGPLLIVAGAGSGKTRVLTRKIAWLIANGAEPRRITAMTFTNKAAEEMRDRIATLAPDDAPFIRMGTFHAFGLAMLRRNYDVAQRMFGLERYFTVLDAKDGADLVESVRTALLSENPDYWDPEESAMPAARFRALVSRKRLSWVPDDPCVRLPQPQERKKEFGGEPLVPAAVLRLEALLAERNCVDFDGLALYPAKMLFENGGVMKRERALLDWLLVDEYQDVSPIQYILMRGLLGPGAQLAVVGDPDQSIYAFRGADVSRILSFERDFGDVSDVAGPEVLKMVENYRSLAPILNGANALIAHNEHRPEKDLRPLRASDGADGVWFGTFATDTDEASAIALAMRDLHSEGTAWSDMALLYRTNALSRGLETALLDCGIPYRILHGASFFDRMEVRDVLAVLSAAMNPRDLMSFRRASKLFVKGFGDVRFAVWADGVSAASRKEPERFEEPESFWRIVAEKGLFCPKGAAGESLRGFAASLAELCFMAPRGVADCINFVLAPAPTPGEPLKGMGLGYGAVLEKRDPDGAADRLENVLEIASIAPDGDLRSALEEAKLRTDADARKEGADSVSLMTVHASKGLEFPAVFVAAMEDGIMPHVFSRTPEGIEEERRLCYVAMTRAQDMLFLSAAARRTVNGSRNAMPLSPFVAEALGPRITDERTVGAFCPFFPEAVAHHKELEPIPDGSDDPDLSDVPF